MAFLRKEKRLSLRQACRLVGISPSVFQYRKRKDRNIGLRREIKRLALKHRRDGYRSLHRLLRWNGWNVNKKRVERIYREEKLQLRRKTKKKLPVHLRMEVPAPTTLNECWSVDFLSDADVTGRQVRILAAIDDASRESLILTVARSMTGAEVAAQLDRVALFRGYPTFLRMDNGPEFRSAALAAWATKHGVTLIFIEPGKPYQNCFVESFNGIFRRKCLDLNVFHNLAHAQAVIDAFRNEYSHDKPHGSLKGTPSGVCFTAQKGVTRQQPDYTSDRGEMGG